METPKVKTRFYKKQRKCYAVFHDSKGFTSYEVTENIYKQFQKWVKHDMEATTQSGVYQSDEKTQTRIRKMLKDHMDFPY